VHVSCPSVRRKNEPESNQYKVANVAGQLRNRSLPLLPPPLNCVPALQTSPSILKCFGDENWVKAHIFGPLMQPLLAQITELSVPNFTELPSKSFSVRRGKPIEYIAPNVNANFAEMKMVRFIFQQYVNSTTYIRIFWFTN
jgi:hypothetical protein